MADTQGVPERWSLNFLGIWCQPPQFSVSEALSLALLCRGGAELLFDGVKKHQVTLPGQEEPWNIQNLLIWVKKNLLKERPELFIAGDSLQPGILVAD